MIYLSTLLISMFITIALIPMLRSMAINKMIVDVPNERKVHTSPIPKTGGIAMALGILVPILLWTHMDDFVRSILMGSCILTIFGLIDDIRELGYKTKLLGQIAAGLIAVSYGGISITFFEDILPGNTIFGHYATIAITLFIITGVTNAINLSDGLDGLAGGITMLSFICIAYLGFCSENNSITLISIAVIGAIFGFLRFNTHPATVFMGDTGSQLLGYLSISTALHLTQGDTPLSPLVPMLLLGFPILDTLTVMTERIANGRSPFVADKNHFHHKLMRLGFFHTEAVFIIYMLQAFLVTSAFIFRFYSDCFLLVYYTIFSGLIVAGFIIADRAGWKLKRFDLIDRVVKSKLKRLREKNYHIKLSFLTVKVGLPILLIFTCFLPAAIPSYFSIIGIVMAILLSSAALYQNKWLGGMIRLSLFMTIPLLVYLGEKNTVSWLNENMEFTYNLSFGMIAVFVILTLKFTRRKEGFKSTPTDFIILFVALVLPNLPDIQIRSYHLGMLTTRIIVFFFSLEVLIGELRKKYTTLAFLTVIVLLILSFRGLTMI
ncbi:MAG: MraY family glycosyltransferase [Pseudomonadota bacterium]